MLFAAGDAGGRAAIQTGAAVAHFDEHRHAPVIHDEIDFAAALMHIGGDKAQPLTLKKGARLGFPGGTGLFAA
ncbi:hypothetical protein ESA_03538 [Cronobacter sakazakii ATCC BAA-894]|uniref:Uncharacterized protein n=1 Tax=Cronobacter sakazakii (strain ATCC BAA-894) TaxID=290339 RepID=A7MIP5_CROS8|nr:hypothetical protein ESA_03538 [Cronobacter sakazakii ATCC BAA-894]